MYPNDQYQPTPPQKRHTIRRIVLVVGVSLIALGVGLNVYGFINAPTCFTASDYVEFYGSAPEDTTFAPGSDFFSSTYQFIPNTTTLNAAEAEASPAEDANNLAAFYKKHSRKLVTFAIETAYPSSGTDGKLVAEKRVEIVKKALTDAGITTELIDTKIEAYDITDEAIEYDDIHNVTLSLKSTEACRE